jgi:DNA gyrase subunit B
VLFRSTAKQGRERRFQAILPLKGKILNVEKARFEKMLTSGEIVALITALGTGIGREDYDPAKARYHRIILMTDADVDGSHIRTLLLTFFYRQMPELIAKGYLYVAQPPLYKVTRGKKELFLKDQRALDDYLLRIAMERAVVETPAGELRGPAVGALLERVAQYQDRLAKLSRRRDPRVLDALVQAARVDETTLLDMNALATQVEAMHTWMRERAPDVLAHLKTFRKDDPEHQAKKLVFRTEMNGSPRETVVDHAFLTSPEYAELVALREVFAQGGPLPYRVRFEESESSANSVQEVLTAVRADASRGLSIQRFKGLGEMNPEQLWDTTMNPDTRTLLQVRVEDAVEADDIFALLMGEAVEPRREFIEKNALDVQNLDI